MSARPRIDWFDGTEFDFLSNFHRHPDGDTVEHHFQAAKTDAPIWVRQILAAPDPGTAKYLGNICPLRPTWEEEKDLVMRSLLLWKFRIPSLREQLLATGDALLIEGNSWGDRYWGEVDGEGLNMLGRLLMVVREVYRAADYVGRGRPTRVSATRSRGRR